MIRATTENEHANIGSHISFEEMCRANRARLTSYANRLLGDSAAAEDVAQETLLRAWTNRETFEEGRDPAPWLYTVARNLCVEVMRSRSRTIPTEELPEYSSEQDPAAPLERAHERHTVRHALSQLSSRHREVLVLRDVHGVQYEELATRLGVSEPTARAVLFRARRSLRERIAQAGVAVLVLWAALRARASQMVRRGSEILRAADATGLVLAQAGIGAVLSSALAFAPAAAAAPAARALDAVVSTSSAHTPAEIIVPSHADVKAAEARPATAHRATKVHADRHGDVDTDVVLPAANGQSGHAWVRIWREHGTDNSTVLETLDVTSDAACASGGAACDAIDAKL